MARFVSVADNVLYCRYFVAWNVITWICSLWRNTSGKKISGYTTKKKSCFFLLVQRAMTSTTKHNGSIKRVPLLFCDNFDNVACIWQFIHCWIQNWTAKEAGIKLCTSLKFAAALSWENLVIRLYKFTAKLLEPSWCNPLQRRLIKRLPENIEVLNLCS